MAPPSLLAAARARAWPAFVIVFYATACTALFAPLFFRHAWFVWDVPDEYWPDLHYLCGALHDRVWPLWNPYDRLGYPFHADPQAGVYAPVNLALCALGGPTPSLFWAGLRVVFYFALAGTTMTGLLRALDLPRAACIVGGLAFMLAPYPRQMWEVNLSYTYACIPIVLWAIEALARAPSARTAARLALAFAFAASVESPPSLFLLTLTAITWGTMRIIDVRTAWPWVGVAAVLTVAITAVMFIPTTQMARESVQSATDYASLSAGGYAPHELLGLVWPRNKYFYLTLPVVALAVWGTVDARNALPRRARITLALLGLFAATMMLGDHTWVYRVAFHALPGVRLFRAPVRYSAILGTCAAILAAAGASRLPWPRITVPLCIIAFMLLVIRALPPDRDFRTSMPPGSATAEIAMRPLLEGAHDMWRMHDEFGLGLRAGTRFALRDLRGYQDPLQSSRYQHLMGRLDRAPHLLEQFNVRYVLRGPHFLHGEGHHYLPTGREAAVAHEVAQDIWNTDRPLPFAYWVDRATTVATEAAAWAQLERTAPARVCLLEAPCDPSPGDGFAASTDATDVHLARNDLAFDIDAPGPGWVVVNEAFDRGWTAAVDGVPHAVWRANVLVRAVQVNAGHHHVTMRFAPRGLRAWLTCAALATLLASALALRPPRRSLRAGTTPDVSAFS